MTSWFGAASNSGASLFKNLKDTVPIPNGLAEKAKKAIKELSLNSDEMVAEREKFKKEEEFKKSKKQWSLEHCLLPWETNDEERCILCDECKEMVMKLSLSEEVFLGPYKENEDGKVPAAILLPADFDLDYYIGVIQKLIRLDQNLSDIHADLIGEDLVNDSDFWKNYFHHCALARIEIGLDTDEFWNQCALKNTPSTSTEVKVGKIVSTNVVHNNTIKVDGSESVKSEEVTFSSQTVPETSAKTISDDPEISNDDVSSPSETKVGGSSSDNSSDFTNVSADELDDLAAEIAKELEN